MKIERIPGKETKTQGRKRQRMPFKIKWSCPHCKTDQVKDLTEYYLSYPIWGEPKKVYFICRNDECEHFEDEVTEADVIPDITMSLEVK